MPPRLAPRLLAFLAASLVTTSALAAPPVPYPPPPPEPPGGGDASPYAQPATGSRQAPLEVAGSPPPRAYPRAPRERWPVYGQLRLSAGRAFPRGIDDAWYGRAELGPTLLESNDGDKAGPIFYASVFALEGWGARGDRGGGSWPVSLHMGYATPHLYLSAGLGANVLLIDHVDGKTGVGALSPLVAANAGIGVGPVHLLADVRAQYRWQLGADDRRMYTAGLALDVLFD